MVNINRRIVILIKIFKNLTEKVLVLVIDFFAHESIGDTVCELLIKSIGDTLGNTKKYRRYYRTNTNTAILTTLAVVVLLIVEVVVVVVALYLEQ